MPIMSMRKQDPSVEGFGVGEVYFLSDVTSGPNDNMIGIRGLQSTVRPNSNNDFIIEDTTQNREELDAVHTFAAVRRTVNMYQRNLKRVGVEQPLTWQWRNQPINVFPDAGEDANAYYSRGEKSLKFFHFTGQNGLVYTCQSFDIVAHETGHAILDAVRPGYFTSRHPETGGLHESFGDLTAIFAMLDQHDVVDKIIVRTKGNLHEQSFFTKLAEQFGSALGRSLGLRNADNNLKLSEVSDQVHDISKVFTGAVYDILVDMFEDARQPEKYTYQDTLSWVGSYLSGLVLAAIMNGPQRYATYSDIAREMYRLTEYEPWKRIIENQFERREVDVLGSRFLDRNLTFSLTQNSFAKCCGTLKIQQDLGFKQEDTQTTATASPTLFSQPEKQHKRSSEGGKLVKPKKHRSGPQDLPVSEKLPMSSFK